MKASELDEKFDRGEDITEFAVCLNVIYALVSGKTRKVRRDDKLLNCAHIFQELSDRYLWAN